MTKNVSSGTLNLAQSNPVQSKYLFLFSFSFFSFQKVTSLARMRSIGAVLSPNIQLGEYGLNSLRANDDNSTTMMMM